MFRLSKNSAIMTTSPEEIEPSSGYKKGRKY